MITIKAEYDKQKALLTQKIEHLTKQIEDYSKREKEIKQETNSQLKEQTIAYKDKVDKYEKTIKSLKTENEQLKEQVVDLEANLEGVDLALQTEKNKNLKNYSLINIQLNLSRKHKHIPPDSHIILNNYNYQEAIKYDLRELCVIFYIFALAKQIFFHTFLFRSPLELFPLRLCLFFFIMSSDLALNALFYFNDNISKKYRNAK